ncbi:uncharacterized protein KY384_007459 [Bacidia gigantensis]|uniref:uncharacterized protein n=1 Tax=Bacidia gigantensis TaxID=2732470 RepID=UPI001D03B43C|nr:uncharacterized protein KY384_007459 [Bacidia gigantensis]KAG8528541.1 hypothetical protein KY384_007459 [Bacidia gigantensis]
MENEGLDFGDSPTAGFEGGLSPIEQADSQAGNDADAAGEQDLNVPGAAKSSRSPSKLSQSTPAPLSDNPLDAPDAPRNADADADKEDEEMGDARSPDKDGEGEGGSPRPTDGQEQSKASIEASARAHLATQRFTVIIPSYSAWFDMNTIHSTETKSLPEFFNSRNRSKTPGVYKDYRDFMINTYRLNPSEYLTVTACRRNLAGDVCAIMRVHAFLEQWGLINYQVDSDSRPSAIGPPFTGHFRVIGDTPRGLQTFQPSPEVKREPGRPFEPTENAISKAYKGATDQERVDFNLEIGRNIYDHKGRDLTAALKEKPQTNGENGIINGITEGDSTSKALEEITKENEKRTVYCRSCAIECTKGYFHYAKAIPKEAKLESLDVCAPCLWDQRISDRTNQSDFVWMEDKNERIPEKDAPWTDAELLLLLEALERFDENWNQIADYVGTRTREECVLKFLQLEIEDKYLEPETNGPSYGALDQGRVPFSQSDNPVLSVLGYLASLSEPSVAAAAAGRSIDEVTKFRRKRLENGQGGDPQDKVSRAEDSMEVDGGASPAVNRLTESDRPSPRDMMRDVANTTFATAAARAAALASNEERELTRLVSATVNVQFEKLELKLKQFSEMEKALQAERRELERGRQQLFLDRLIFRKRVLETQEALKNTSPNGGDDGAATKGDIGLANESGDKLGFVREGAQSGGLEPPAAGANYEI